MLTPRKPALVRDPEELDDRAEVEIVNEKKIR